MGVGAADGEATDHRYVALVEHPGSGQARRLPAAQEIAADAQALGVILTVAGVVPGLGFEGVDKALRGQALGADPAGSIGKAGGQGGKPEANGSQAQGAGATV
ncbi:hypothetical protein D9M71_521120 [compost metagenome]